MPLWLQHALVVGIALACAAVIVLRRVRALAGKAPSCDGCAKGCDDGAKTETDGGEKLIPVASLVRARPARR